MRLLAYGSILGRDLPSSPCFPALVIIILSAIQHLRYPTSRCAAKRAAHEFSVATALAGSLTLDTLVSCYEMSSWGESS